MPVVPVPGSISHKFGEDRGSRRHNGVDYPVGKGTPVKASASGLVVRSTIHEPTEEIVTGKNGKEKKKFTGAYGNVIIIYHGQDMESYAHTYTLYAHLNERSVRVKQEVRQGQVIGTSGRSGTRQDFYNRKGGYELHFEVIKSPTELYWVKAGYLDYHFAAENRRMDPESFLRSPFGVSVRLPVSYCKLPVGLDFKKNIEEAKKMNIIPDNKLCNIPTSNISMKTIETLLEGMLFANAVWPGGKWNMRVTYKNSGLIREELTNLGNYNYGLTGIAAGYSRFVLHRMADILQGLTGKHEPEYGPWPSDNPQDTYWINQGIKDYNAGIWN